MAASSSRRARRSRQATELTYDYKLSVDGKLTKKELARFECRCGSPKCRGSLLTKPKKKKKKDSKGKAKKKDAKGKKKNGNAKAQEVGDRFRGRGRPAPGSAGAPLDSASEVAAVDAPLAARHDRLLKRTPCQPRFSPRRHPRPSTQHANHADIAQPHNRRSARVIPQ